MKSFYMQEAKRKKEEEIAKLKVEEQRKRQEVRKNREIYIVVVGVTNECNLILFELFFSRKRREDDNTWL